MDAAGLLARGEEQLAWSTCHALSATLRSWHGESLGGSHLELVSDVGWRRGLGPQGGSRSRALDDGAHKLGDDQPGEQGRRGGAGRGAELEARAIPGCSLCALRAAGHGCDAIASRAPHQPRAVLSTRVMVGFLLLSSFSSSSSAFAA